MKTKMELMSAAFLGLMGAMPLAHAHAQVFDSSAARVEIPVRALLAPQYGYEEKNSVGVVLYGMLPNSCYTLSDSVVNRLPDGRTIEVRQYAIHESQGVCAQEATLPEHMQMVIPFSTEVQVGQLPAGEYAFQYQLDTGRVGTRLLEVAKNITPTTDTLPYAASSAVSAPDVVNGKDSIKVKISGVLNSTCTRIDNGVRVIVEDDVFVLMPTIHVKTGVMCGQVMVPFQKTVDLGKTFPGVHLVQVRSMNGRAVNKVVVVTK